MLLIDAYNVLHVTGVLPPHLGGLDLDGLLRLIGASRYAGREIVVVCDGTPPRHGAGSTPRHHPERTQRRARGIRLVFAGAGLEADDVIESILAGEPRSRRITVVSNDRRLRRAARRLRRATLSSDAFLAHLAHDHDRPAPAPRAPATPAVPLSRAETAHWLQAMPVDIPALEAALRATPDPVPIPAPATPPVSPPQEASRNSQAPRPAPRQEPRHPPAEPTVSPARPRPADAELARLLRDCGLDLSLDDLDMRRWLTPP